MNASIDNEPEPDDHHVEVHDGASVDGVVVELRPDDHDTPWEKDVTPLRDEDAYRLYEQLREHFSHSSETGAESTDGIRLAEDFILLGDAVNDGLYKALRYQTLGYGHLREDALDKVVGIQEMTDEMLQREVQTGD